jgi:peptidoglycan/xylan/chitin deacetylase (PgdA/CDA1 family)
MEEAILLFALCHFIGLISMGRWLIRRAGTGVIILNYHRASGKNLRSHLLYYCRHYRIMHLEDALEELLMPGAHQEKLRDGRTILVLTFDDGFRDNYTHAFAFAKELQIPVTIFLVPGYIGSHRRFWWLEPDQLVKHAQVREISFEKRTYHLKKPADRKRLSQVIYSRLFSAKSVSAREAILNEMRTALAVPTDYIEDNQCVLTWEEIYEMQESGWVSFGAHTMHHSVLAELLDPLEVQDEIHQSRTLLQQRLGHPIRTFAYPLGKSKHIGEEAFLAVQRAGYSWAVTTEPGINTPRSHSLLLQRFVVNAESHWLVPAAFTSGIGTIFLPLFSSWKALASAAEWLCAFLLASYRHIMGEAKSNE